jgi:pyruvate ferredoxin oxidoreductase gamma subunit
LNGGREINTDIIAIRMHGRGGQGAVTSAELLASAAINEEKYAQAMPGFGPERRGAPVQAFVRISSHQIRNRAEILEPDIVMVLDPGLLSIINFSSGLKDNGTVIVNVKDKDIIPQSIIDKYKVAYIDAMSIAKSVLGVPIVNTTMLGALIKATRVVDIASLETPLNIRFGKLAEKNFNAMKKAFEETIILEK